MITRQQIRQFLAVVDEGNFTRASNAIGVTQPSLSSGIRELESQIGAKLFERLRPTVRLTSAGNRLLPIGRRIERDFRRAEIETVRAHSSRQAFVLGVIPSVPTALLEMGIATSGLEALVIRETQEPALNRELRRGLIDAAISSKVDPIDDTLLALDLWEDPYQLVLPASHRLASRKEVNAEELADEVMIARRSCELLSATSKFFTDRGVRPHFSFKSANDDRAIAMVAAGLGLTVAPASLLRHGVVGLTLSDFNHSREMVQLVRRDDYENSPRYRDQADAMARSLREASES